MVCTEKAFAKLNLSLDIVGRRDDGYHDMRMVMQSIDLADTVTVAPQTEAGLCLTADLPYLPRGGGNIAVKAAVRFFEDAGLPCPGLAIDLQKHIPICAGMGGGSSDGAAVLRVLRRLYRPELSRERLEEIGARVGSDVPYCVRGGTVLAEGRGERLTDLPAFPSCWLAVCKPACAVSTPELFRLVRVKRLRLHPKTDELLSALSAGDLEGAARRLYNVFEDVLPRKYHAVFEIKGRMLELGAMASSMTGSGPTVFGIFRDRDPAEQAVAELAASYPDTFLCVPVPAAV